MASGTSSELESMEVDESHPPSITTDELEKSMTGLSTEGDCGKICIEVESDFRDAKWTKHLHKALQSYLNKCHKKCEVQSITQTGQNSVEAEISPIAVIEDLLQAQSVELLMKDLKKHITVRFSQRAPEKMPSDSVNFVTLTGNQQSANGKAYGRQSTMTNDGPKPPLSDGGACGVEDKTLKLPLFHYQQFREIYSDEIESIEMENGVTIDANVMISVTPAQQERRREALERARNDFTKLVQNHTDITSVSVSESSLSGGLFEEILKKIFVEKDHLALSVSGQGCYLSGPEKSVNTIQRRAALLTNLQAVPHKETPKRLGSHTSVPVLEDGLKMLKFYWEFIQHVFCKRLEAIKSKFGVVFVDQVISEDVFIKAQGASDSLQHHAVTALAHLYQKVATSIMSCTLQNQRQEDMIKDFFAKIDRQYPNVANGSKYGEWRLIGLVEHLAPAMDALEKEMGGPVFKENIKLRKINPAAAALGTSATSSASASAEEEETCPICMDTFKNTQTLDCTHKFCRECLEKCVNALGSSCPVCKKVFGKLEGNQPKGKMTWRSHRHPSLEGFPGCGVIQITYDIPDGIQTDKHPNPGRRFTGTNRTAYLPDSDEGKVVLALLKKAFDQKLIFTVGESRTTGHSNMVTWNDIHHKTRMTGGPLSYGYPDPNYLKRVKEELKAKGIE